MPQMRPLVTIWALAGSEHFSFSLRVLFRAAEPNCCRGCVIVFLNTGMRMRPWTCVMCGGVSLHKKRFIYLIHGALEVILSMGLLVQGCGPPHYFRGFSIKSLCSHPQSTMRLSSLSDYFRRFSTGLLCSHPQSTMRLPRL